MIIYEIAERFGYRIDEIYGMETSDFQRLVEYARRRPIGYRDDIRAYRMIEFITPHKSSDIPKSHHLFPAIAPLIEEQEQNEAIRMQKLKQNSFLAFAQTRAHQMGEDILKFEED